MFNFFYDLSLLLISLLALPKILWQWAVQGKYRNSFSERLKGTVPQMPLDAQVIWIHAVSMGETRAVIPFFRLLQKNHPDALIVISSTTETGHAEAQRSMPEAAAHFYLPIDFSWIIKKVMKRIHPKALILCESDFWYQLIAQAKAQGASVMLINGKVSERSCNRFRQFSFFSKRLFDCFDHLCLQSNRFKERFLSMGLDPKKITVTGNLKFDATPKILASDALQTWKKELGIQEKDRVLVIGSTHAPEEEKLIDALQPVWEKFPNLKVLLVPRHPERFAEVAALFKPGQLATYSNRAAQRGDERIVLIDAMGLLNQCYQVAEVAIVAGSFTDTVGGHNIFEPVLLEVPVLFGPHMKTQLDLVDLVLSGQAGLQVSLEELPSVLINWFSDPKTYNRFKQSCTTLKQQVQGSAMRTYEAFKAQIG